MPRTKTSVRDKFIEGGLKCFHATGYKGTSIEDLAEAAGVLKGSFYNHFESKEALAVEVVAVYENTITSNLVLRGPPSAYRRLKNHFEFHAQAQKEREYKLGCLMSNFSVEISQAGEPLRLAVEQSFARWYAVLAIVVRQAQKEGDIDSNYDPDQYARFLANSWEGATNFSKVIGTGQPLDDFFTFVFPRKRK